MKRNDDRIDRGDAAERHCDCNLYNSHCLAREIGCVFSTSERKVFDRAWQQTSESREWAEMPTGSRTEPTFLARRCYPPTHHRVPTHIALVILNRLSAASHKGWYALLIQQSVGASSGRPDSDKQAADADQDEGHADQERSSLCMLALEFGNHHGAPPLTSGHGNTPENLKREIPCIGHSPIAESLPPCDRACSPEKFTAL